jgi:putative endonuclease
MTCQKTNWYVYLLRCSDNTLYCGISNNLDKRLAAHNQGTASKYTRARLPVTLVWYMPCGSHSDALKHEIYIKNLTRKEKLKLVEMDLCTIYTNRDTK